MNPSDLRFADPSSYHDRRRYANPDLSWMSRVTHGFSRSDLIFWANSLFHRLFLLCSDLAVAPMFAPPVPAAAPNSYTPAPAAPAGGGDYSRYGQGGRGRGGGGWSGRGGWSSRGGGGGGYGGGGRGGRGRDGLDTLALPKPDFRSLIPFEKNFYVESPSVQAMSEAEVVQYRRLRDMTVEGNDVPKPVRYFQEANFPGLLRQIITSNFILA